MPVQTPIAVADRVHGFSYAIRNIVTEARKVEASGRKVWYLNIGDPVPFGFAPPPAAVEALQRALRDGRDGYVPSPGIPEAREAIAEDWTRHGFPAHPDRVLVTAGTSEGIELTLTALVNPGEAVLVPSPTYPLYTAVLAKIGAVASYYRTDPGNGWLPDLEHLESLITARTRALVVIDPNNPTGAVYPEQVRRALIAIAEKHDLVILADEVYGDLAYDGPVPSLGSLEPDAPIISFSSLSKAYLAPGWRSGWLVVGRSPRLDDLLAALKKLADGRLCSNGPSQYAIAPALLGDRSYQNGLRAALRERANLTTAAFNQMPGMSVVPPRGAFYAMPKVELRPGDTDEQFILQLLRSTGVLCVYGSGFGMPPAAGFFRVVFLAAPAELTEIYTAIAQFTREYQTRVSDPVRQDPRSIIAWTVGLVALTVLALWAMYLARDVILLIYISIVLAIGFGPIVRAVERRPLLVGKRRVPRWLAILAIYLAMLGVLVFVAAAGLPPLVAQARALGAGLPGMVERAQAYLVSHGLLEHQLTWQELVQRVPAGVAGVGGDAVTTVLLTVIGVAGGAFGVVTILILTFYLLVEADEIFDTMTRLVPPRHRARFAAASHNISIKVSAWLGGQLLLGLLIGSSATIGLWLIGVPYFFVLGVVAGIGELIPMVGPLLAAIPAVAVALSVSTGHAIAVAIFFIVQQQVENHVLVPKIMSKQVGVSAVTVLVALLVGASLLGIIGALLAVPTAAMIQVVFDELTRDD